MMRKAGFSLSEYLWVIVLVVILAIIVLPMLAKSHESGRRASCQGNLKELGQALRLYAKESGGGKYPPTKYLRGDTCEKRTMDFFFQPDLLYPAYFTNIWLCVCPSDEESMQEVAGGRWSPDDDYSKGIAPCLIDTSSYAYLAWATSPAHFIKEGADPNGPDPFSAIDDAALAVVTQLAEKVKKLPLAEARDFLDEDVPYPPPDKRALHRLADGVEKHFADDPNDPKALEKARGDIPVMFDLFSVDATKFNHAPGGANVLFLDGNVEFVRYPGKWPVTKVIALMSAM
ncbi:MAG: hypothetical protein JXR94_14650 [Candidatus Hydrogenedentes bacterium]|nr:hypothetical protein [Candidatus Hydrogenedentota bacterium]